MTTDTDDPFTDLKQHRLTPETLAKLAVVPRKVQKHQQRGQQQFVMVPWAWIDRLARTSSANTYRVAFHLLFQHWKHSHQSFLLPNGQLAIEGVTRHAKQRALDELEQLGLVSVEKRHKRSPRIAVHV